MFAFRQSYELGADLIKINSPKGSLDLSIIHSLIPNLPIAMRGGEVIDDLSLIN